MTTVSPLRPAIRSISEVPYGLVRAEVDRCLRLRLPRGAPASAFANAELLAFVAAVRLLTPDLAGGSAPWEHPFAPDVQVFAGLTGMTHTAVRAAEVHLRTAGVWLPVDDHTVRFEEKVFGRGEGAGVLAWDAILERTHGDRTALLVCRALSELLAPCDAEYRRVALQEVARTAGCGIDAVRRVRKRLEGWGIVEANEIPGRELELRFSAFARGAEPGGEGPVAGPGIPPAAPGGEGDVLHLGSMTVRVDASVPREVEMRADGSSVLRIGVLTVECSAAGVRRATWAGLPIGPV